MLPLPNIIQYYHLLSLQVLPLLLPNTVITVITTPLPIPIRPISTNNHVCIIDIILLELYHFYRPSSFGGTLMLPQ